MGEMTDECSKIFIGLALIGLAIAVESDLSNVQSHL